MISYAGDDPRYEAIVDAINAADPVRIAGDTLGCYKIDNLNTTEDCVEVLNSVLGVGPWKRISKRKFNDIAYRSFINNDTRQKVTIYHSPEYGVDSYAWILDFSLKDVESEIHQIIEYCKHYIDADGGVVLYNPETKSVILSGSDSGFWWVPITEGKLAVMEYLRSKYPFDGEEDDTKDIDNVLPFLNSAFCLDEHIPEPEHGYIEISKLKTLCDLGIDDEEFA